MARPSHLRRIFKIPPNTPPPSFLFFSFLSFLLPHSSQDFGVFCLLAFQLLLLPPRREPVGALIVRTLAFLGFTNAITVDPSSSIRAEKYLQATSSKTSLELCVLDGSEICGEAMPHIAPAYCAAKVLS